MEPTIKLIEIARLIARKREGLLTVDEEQILQEWLDEDSAHIEMFNQLMKDETIYKDIEVLDSVPYKQAFEKTWGRINKKQSAKKIPLVRKTWQIAASILLLLGTSLGIYFGWMHSPHENSLTEISQPGSSKAILITGNQEEIVLGDTSKVYKLVSESGVSISDSASVLTYHSIDTIHRGEEPINMNTLITPRGGEYSLLLADGTEIIMNSDSKLIFPDKFSGDIREVELQGEAYFRVAKSQKKFVVNSKSMDVVVYGTEFNLSVYDDEPEIHATLVEGSVGVRLHNNNPDTEYELSPGEQFKLENQSGKLSIVPVDTDLVTAWTRNIFRFDNEELGHILMKLAKWYNFEYSFDDDRLQTKSFTCDLMKYDDITPILELISRASDVEFSVNRNTLIVKEEVKK